MSKKQIKDLLIRTKSDGAKEAASELRDLNNEIDKFNASSKETLAANNVQARSMINLAKQASKLSGSFSGIQKSISSVNKAINGSTKTSEKNISNYMDSLDLVTMTLASLDAQALKTAKSLSEVNGNASGVKNYEAALDDILDTLIDISQGTQEYLRALDRQTDAIFDVETQTRKARKENNKYSTSIDGTTTAIGKATKASERLAKNKRNSRGTFSELAKIGGPLTMMYATVAANVFALSEAFQLLNAAQDRARFAQSIQPQLVLEYGGALGAAADSMTRFGLAYEDATRRAAKGATMGLDADQMGSIVEIAKKASVVLGRDFAESVDRLTLGIAKQERELLDEFGIIVSLTEAQEKYAASIGKTRNQLSSYERQQAFANAVTKEGLAKYKDINAELTRSEILLKDVTNGWEQFSIGLAEGKGIVGTLAQGLLFTTEGLVKVGRELTSTDDFTIMYEKLGKASREYNRAVEGGNPERIAKMAEEVTRLGKAFFYAEKGLPGWYTALKITDTVEFEGMKRLATAAVDGTITVDKSLIALSSSIRVQGKSISEAWDSAVSSFKVPLPFNTIISELREYQRLSAEVATKDSALSATSMKRFKALQSSLGITSDQANEAIAAFEKLNMAKAGRDADLITTQQANTRLSGGGADAQMSLPIAEANMSVETEMKNVATLKSLYDLGVVSTAELGDAINKLNLAQAKQAAEVEKLNRAEQASLITKRELTELGALDIERLNSSNASSSADISQRQLEVERQILDARKENGEISSLQYANSVASLVIKKKILDIESERAIKAEEISRREAKGVAALANLDKLAGNEATRTALAQKRLDLELQILKARKENGEISDLEYQNSLTSIGTQQDSLTRRKDAAPAADASAVFGSMQGLEGLSGLQNTGLDMAQNFTNTFAKAQEAGVGFTDFLKANAEGFMEFSTNIANSAGSIFQAISDAKISSIDSEIAAEKRRDGKSKESLEKIKKLEKQKTKEKEKAGIAQVGISTAMAIMQGYAQLGPIAGSFAAAAMVALGAMQIASIKKASAGQVSALGGGNTPSITAGSRNNQVDVSGAASAGEYAFVTGAAGSGTGANNFTPGRLGGGYSSGGTAITVGERGPETITPALPVKVAASGESAGGASIVFAPVLNANTIDSKGMAEVLETYSTELYDGLERELRARNLTLENLER